MEEFCRHNSESGKLEKIRTSRKIRETKIGYREIRKISGNFIKSESIKLLDFYEKYSEFL